MRRSVRAGLFVALALGLQGTGGFKDIDELKQELERGPDVNDNWEVKRLPRTD